MEEPRRDERLLAAGINLLADVTTARVVRAFRAAGLDCILLKGRTSRGWIDDDPERLSGDVDLLIDPDTLAAAEAVLEQLGFARQGSLDAMPGDRPYHARNWAAPDGAVIDLHRHIVGVGVPAGVAWGILSTTVEQIDVQGEPVTALAPQARALHLALHAAQHGARESRTVGDLELGLDVLTDALWADAASLASRLDAEAAFSAGLRLTSRGTLLADRLGLPDDAPVQVALWASSPPPMTAGFEWLSTIRSPRERAVFVLRKVFPPPEWLRAWKPVARRGRVGLAVAYVWRPVWLAGHALPAYLAWRQLRRDAGR